MSIARAFTKKLMFVAEEAGKEAMDISRKQVLEAFHKKTKDEFKSNKVAELRKHLAEGDTFSFDVKGTTFTIRAKEGFDVAQLKKTFPKLMFHLQHFFNVVLGGFWRGGRLLKNQTIKLQKEALEKAKKAANNTPEKALEKLQTELREATDAGAPPDKIKAIKEKIAQAEEQINAPKQVGRLTEENEALQNKLGQYEAREFGREAGKQAADLIGGTTGTGNVHKQLKTKAADLASQLKDKDAILTAKNRHAQIIANDISIEETLSEVRNIARRKTFTTQSSLGHQVKELKTKAQELHHANLIDANELTTINQTIEQLEITQNQLNRVNTQKKSLETTIRQRERKLSQHTKMGKKSLTKPINSKATNSIQNDTILKTKQQQLKKLEQQERLLNTEASRQLQAAEDTMTQPLVNLREEMETLSPELKRTFNAKRAEAKKLEQLTKKKFEKLTKEHQEKLQLKEKELQAKIDKINKQWEGSYPVELIQEKCEVIINLENRITKLSKKQEKLTESLSPENNLGLLTLLKKHPNMRGEILAEWRTPNKVRIGKTNKKIEQVAEELKNLKEEKGRLESELNANKPGILKEFKEFKAKKQAYENEIEFFRHSNKELETKIITLKTQNEKITLHTKQNEKALTQLENHLDQALRSEKELSDNSSQIKKELQKVKKERATLKQKYNQLQKTMTSMQKDLSEGTYDSKKEALIQQLQQEIEDIKVERDQLKTLAERKKPPKQPRNKKNRQPNRTQQGKVIPSHSENKGTNIPYYGRIN